MAQFLMRFSLTDDTGAFDALAGALRRESGAVIVKMNEQTIITMPAGGVATISQAVTMLVKGDQTSVDSATRWLCQLVGSKNIELMAEDVIKQILFDKSLEARKEGCNDAALEWFERLLAIDDTLYSVWGNRANVLADLDRLDEAENSYQRAIALSPSNGILHFNIGTLQIRRGQVADARASFIKAHQLDPTLDVAVTALKNIEIFTTQLISQ